MAVQHIRNIRDLLVAIIAPEMSRARDSGSMRRRYLGEPFDYDEAQVAWVLDALTIKSLEGLIALRQIGRAHV